MENNEILLEEEEQDNIQTLTDENGEDVEFEYLDTIKYEGKEYIVQDGDIMHFRFNV